MQRVRPVRPGGYSFQLVLGRRRTPVPTSKFSVIQPALRALYDLGAPHGGATSIRRLARLHPDLRNESSLP